MLIFVILKLGTKQQSQRNIHLVHSVQWHKVLCKL